MKHVYHLNIKISKNANHDLYFENQEIAESVAELLMKSLTEEGRKKIKITANIHEVYSGQTASEQLLIAMGVSKEDIDKLTN